MVYYGMLWYIPLVLISKFWVVFGYAMVYLNTSLQIHDFILWFVVLADGAVDRKVAWVSFTPVKVEDAQERGVKGMSQPLVSRATMEVALTQRNPIIVTGVLMSNVGQPIVSRATTEVALTQRNPVIATVM